MKYIPSLFIFSLVLLLSIGCAKRKAEKQAKEDDEIIQAYLTAHNYTATKMENGLYVMISTQGTGPECNSSSNVKVYYKGYFTDETVFDQSSTSGITFNLSQVIRGWTEGIPAFKEGGIGKLFIPSALAYGRKGTQGIPANSVLIFDIKLIDVL